MSTRLHRRTRSLFRLCLGLLLGGFVPARAADAESPKHGAALLKTDLLGVFAHPDDETGMAATIASIALGEGRQVAHVYVTRGEGGGNMVGTQSGAALGILREAELRDCLAELGVRSCYFLDQTDFFYTESLAATLRKWNRDEALGRLVRLVRSLRPEVIVTMNPAPNPGQHGHHQAAGVLATEAFQVAADPNRYPEQLTGEGLHPWQARKLFYGGVQGPHVITVSTTDPLPDGRIPAEVAAQALRHHRSQGFGAFTASPWLRRPQSFTLVKGVLMPTAEGHSFFEGLPLEDSLTPPLQQLATPAPDAPLRFVPRPAIVRYLQWVRNHHLDFVAADFPSDLPVVAGEANSVMLEIDADQLGAARESFSLDLPAGWIHADTRMEGTAGQKDDRPRMVAMIQPPADAHGAVEVVARISTGSKPMEARARLNPVPLARVPSADSPPALDGTSRRWEPASNLSIGTNRIWQGQIDNPADNSAEVRIVRYQQRLFVDIEVKDDVVVTNIAPDDIKGHWRSDSVEICLDPAAGAEDTTGCFKVGIFPFDTSGQVRAARDADAQPGPVETMAPGMRLISRRTPDGYRIQAEIPLALVTRDNPLPQRMGFNVLIYDGDKADAMIGENINESRLAWSPRSGVQGRPEDWGRIDLR